MNTNFARVEPALHLPRAPCDKFVYDFPYGWSRIVDGYGLRRMRLRVSYDFCTDSRGNDRDNARRLYGNRAISVQLLRSLRKLSTEIVRSRAASVH